MTSIIFFKAMRPQYDDYSNSPRNNDPNEEEPSLTICSDNQQGVVIQFVNGELQMTKDTHILGRFNIESISPANEVSNR